MRQLVLLLSVLLVLVSPCPDFSFKTEECVPAEVVCDFKGDRQDGSDEEFCGSCDFEHHSCGWNNSGDTLYSWRLQMANSSSVPGFDHTTGSPWGHVMQIDKKGGPSVFSKAILEFPVDSIMALGCSISFWYHIYDNGTYTSSDMKVKMVRGSTEEVFLKISKRNTNGWENATVFIGNRPEGYKLQFVLERPFLGDIDVMLDDIMFNNCAAGDIPAGSEQLSCDFENDTCSWYHDYTASLLWQRSKHEFGNNPEVTGYHMIITADRSVNINSTARLVSIVQPAHSVMCVSFWYHIFGNSIGSLKFITKHPGEAETVVWMRSGTQGNKWRFVDLTFQSDKPIQFVIEAVVGGTQGSISIDDIVVSSSTSGSCPAERECTFQGSLCGLQPFGDSSWRRITGSSLLANAPGPLTDHTLGTDQGYYLSSQLWNHTTGSRVTVMTAEMSPTPPEGECLMFWYHMEGKDIGELNVYLQTSENQPPVLLLWSRNGDQGKHWRHGRVTLYSPHEQYKVIFEAVAGAEPSGDIAIDDLIVLNDACPPRGFCDFEMDFCGWVNSPPAELGLHWDWLSGSSSGSFIPKRDHSLDSPLGHFAFYLNAKPNDTAQLASETMEGVEKACLELWHYSLGWSIERPSNIILTVFVNETDSLRPVWSTTGFLNNTWILSRVDYTASGLHQVVLKATCPKSDCGSMSLDDVHIVRDRACDDSILTTTAPPATTTTSAPACPMDCTFEQGLCSWVPEVNADLNWTLRSGLHVDHPWDGPQYDHTVGNNEGSFLLLNGAGSKDGEMASISVPVMDVSSELCVEFWYYMLGPAVSTLDLLVQTQSSELLVWTRSGSQNQEWLKAEVNISRTDITRLMFSAHRNTTSRGFIAIDDISVKKGVCHNQNACGFDSSWCDFNNDVSHLGRWSRTKATKQNQDHTYGTEQGFYMNVMTSNSNQTEVAQLLSHELPPALEMCVRFWYWLPAESSNTLAVHLFWSGELHEQLWESSSTASKDWEVAEVTVWAPAKFHVVFKALDVPGMTSTVKIDDVSVKNGACSVPGSCDFESGLCTWGSIPGNSGHDWVLASGGFLGPPTDHTTQTPDGGFLLSSPQHLNHSSKAQILSEWLHPADTSSCLSLWSFMGTRDSGMLQLHLRFGPTEEDLTFPINSSAHEWSRFSQSLNMNSKPFQLLIEAETNTKGYVAIDDITITPGLCEVNESSSGFVGCSFENGTCGWEDLSTGRFEWVRGRNTSGHGGPSVDNTLGNELGWYMAVKDDRRDHGSPAVLLSPLMKQASVNCTLHFYYNMFGPDIGDLNVLLKNGPRSTVLWWLSGNQEDKWHHAEVLVSRVPRDFNILFEARTLAKRGHIAIDDVDFANCSLPGPQPSCPGSMFTCENSACVELNRVCDFSDDCGDRSDENNCGEQGVVERCSFENGLCLWAESESDTPGAKWTRQRGQDVWPKSGPPRDHTKNSAAGHYIIPGDQLNEKEQTSEILSKTLRPSVDCTVRFFYYSRADAAANLTTQSRTQRSGDNDTVLWVRENSHSYSWKRAEVTFSSTINSKIVFHWEHGEGRRGLVALDDISFSRDCHFDPHNSKLPDTSATSPPPSSTSAPISPTSASPVNPCQEDEFYCWLSAGEVCVQAPARCDYHNDCPQGEDEDGCGPCTFERDQCGWTDMSSGPSKWLRQKADNNTVPSTDHTTDTGYYMRVNFSDGHTQDKARLQSPTLPPSSPYCQLLFHFHISAEASGSLRVLMQQAEGSEAILWSRSHNTVSQWTPEHLPLGQHQPGFKVWFGSINNRSTENGQLSVAVDDISFVNCEKSFQPPAVSSVGCSFEDGLCSWLQGAEDELDWFSGSGPTETPNTGPEGDHTTGNGKYLYLKTSPPSQKENMAQLKSTLLPPAGEQGYCFKFWYHMFGATVGSLRMFLQTTDPLDKTLVWQKSGNQGDEWRLVRSHVTSQKVLQVILEATVGGEAGVIAIDDISLSSGPCPASDLCDFEEDGCGWQQHSNDDFDWIRQSGSDHSPHSEPDTDHTTNTPAGHYYYLPSSVSNQTGQTAAMSSPLHPADTGSCVQLWYHMLGKETGTLNVYQQSEEGKQVLLFSQTGEQGRLWRFAQASLLPRVQPYRIVVEGVMAGPSLEGGIAFDDVQLTEAQCPHPGHCDFEINMCSWSNVGAPTDQEDWLRGRGASQNPNTGPSVDHTTNSSHGHYVYVDSSVGQWGDQSFLISEVFQPSTRGHCITFWYHMNGSHVGTLKLSINDRKTHDTGNEEGMLKWIETGDRGDQWQEASVFIKHQEAFWFVFVYQRGRNTGGDVALDDIAIVPFPCNAEPPVDPPDEKRGLFTVGLAVGLTLLAGFIISVFIFVLNRRRSRKNEEIMTAELSDQNSMLGLVNFRIDEREKGSESDFSFFNSLYDPSAQDGTETDA